MFVMEKAPKSIDAEAYRSLRSNIEYSSFDDEYRVIVVTSSVPGEGKSTTSGNLAIALAQSGNSVLLVDCDMRKPSIHKKFKISNAAGTAELLLRKKLFEEVANKYNENLTIITAGKIPPNPSEMLASRAMTAFIEEMKKEFKYIILDTPPLQAVTDAQVLSTKVKHSTRHNSTVHSFFQNRFFLSNIFNTSNTATTATMGTPPVKTGTP